MNSVDPDPTPGPVADRALLVILPLAVIAGALPAVLHRRLPDELRCPTRRATQPGATGGSSSGSASTLDGNWNIASGSAAGYRVREKLAGLPAQSDAVGRTEAVTGTVTVRTAGSHLMAEGVNVEVDVSQAGERRGPPRQPDQHDGPRDRQVPEGDLHQHRPGDASRRHQPRRGGQGRVTGELTIHGVTKAVTIPLDVRLDGRPGRGGRVAEVPVLRLRMSPPSIGGFVPSSPTPPSSSGSCSPAADLGSAPIDRRVGDSVVPVVPQGVAGGHGRVPECFVELVDEHWRPPTCRHCGKDWPARMKSCPECLAELRPDPERAAEVMSPPWSGASTWPARGAGALRAGARLQPAAGPAPVLAHLHRLRRVAGGPRRGARPPGRAAAGVP